MKNEHVQYKLNTVRSWEPKGHKQARASAIVEEYLRDGGQCSLGELQDHLEACGLGQLMETHGKTSLWLARKSRQVIVQV
jgi:hypothetical protein